MTPGSVEAWPASQMMSKRASGQALCSFQALSSGVTTSKRPWTIQPDVADPVDVLQDPAVLVEEALVREEVAFDPREGDREVFFVELGRARLGAAQRDRIAPPLAPGRRGLRLAATRGRGEAAMIGRHQVSA